MEDTTKSNEKWQFIDCLIILLYWAGMGAHCFLANKPMCPPGPQCPQVPLWEVCWRLLVRPLLCTLSERCWPARLPLATVSQPAEGTGSDRSPEIIYNRMCFHFCIVSLLLESEKYTGLKNQFMLYLLLLQGQKGTDKPQSYYLFWSNILQTTRNGIFIGFFSTLWGWNS